MRFGLLAFVLSGVIFWVGDVVRAGKWTGAVARLSALRVLCAVGALLVLLTEGLSHFRALTPLGVERTWTVVFVIAVGFFLMVSLRRLLPDMREGAGSLAPRLARGAWIRIRREWRRATASRGRVIFWLFLAAWLGTLLVIALVAPPNNHDSLTYRLPRVMHWAQNQSIEFYATEISRQNHRAPMAEWILLHLYLLSGRDQLFNLLQWLGLAGCCLGVYELTARFTGDRAMRGMAVLIALTTPMAILQATSTQSDLVSSFFFLAFLVFGLRLVAGAGMETAAFCGMALGLALLTRTPNFIFAGVFSLWFAVELLRRRGWPALPVGIVCGSVALLLIAGHSVRNLEMFGGPFGPATGGESGADGRGGVSELNASMNLHFFASNVLRNGAMHLQSPIHNLNVFLSWAVWKIHGFLGMDWTEAAITWPGTTPDFSYLRHEDIAGNLPQILLFLFALGAMLAGWRRISPALKTYGLLIVFAFAVFCGLLRWQPWHPRIELPLFLAMAPFIAVVLRLGSNQLGAGVAVACVGFGLPFVLDSCQRPMFGNTGIFALSRESLYFQGDVALADEFREAARILKRKKYVRVGLKNGVEDRHYPLWPLYRARSDEKLRFDEVLVSNASRKLVVEGPFQAIVVTHPWEADKLEVGDVQYIRIWSGRQLVIFEAPQLH